MQQLTKKQINSAETKIVKKVSVINDTLNESNKNLNDKIGDFKQKLDENTKKLDENTKKLEEDNKKLDENYNSLKVENKKLDQKLDENTKKLDEMMASLRNIVQMTFKSLTGSRASKLKKGINLLISAPPRRPSPCH